MEGGEDMDRRAVIDFNVAYSYEPTKEEQQLIAELLTVWGKLETSAAKNPALIRKGITFGLGLRDAMAKGQIIPRPAKAKRAGTKAAASADEA